MKNENENIQDPELNPEEEQEIQESTEVDELTKNWRNPMISTHGSLQSSIIIRGVHRKKESN